MYSKMAERKTYRTTRNQSIDQRRGSRNSECDSKSIGHPVGGCVISFATKSPAADRGFQDSSATSMPDVMSAREPGNRGRNAAAPRNPRAAQLDPDSWWSKGRNGVSS